MAITQMPNYLQPSQGKGLYAGNYLNFLDANHQQWSQQFLPDVYDKEIEIYGNRTISGFLKMVSAEMPSSSDQIIWLEQGRLHTRYANVALFSATDATTLGATALAGTDAIAAGDYVGGTVNFTGVNANPTGSQSNTQEGDDACNFSVGQTVMVGFDNGTAKGVVTHVSGNDFIFQAYKAVAAGTASAAVTNATALVYGSEFAKGTGNFNKKLDPSYSTYSNAPIIMKEHYAINGSDTGQIGWIEVTSENGASGYLWYVKAEHENRLRWEDYLEMSMVEGVKNDAGVAHQLNDFRGDGGAATSTSLGARGTQGFFDALEERGNIYDDLSW